MESSRSASVRQQNASSAAESLRSLGWLSSQGIAIETEEIEVPVPWGHIRGTWWGRRDAVPLVGLHGFKDSAGTFDRLAPLLDVPAFLALDLPGHGKSSHYPRGLCYNFSDFVCSFRLVQKHFAWTRMSLLGHSFGSLISFMFAGCFPDEVQGLISLDCARSGMALYPGTPQLTADNVDTAWKQVVTAQTAPPPRAMDWEDLLEKYCWSTLGSVDKHHGAIILRRNVQPHPTQRGAVQSTIDYRMRTGILEGRPNLESLLSHARNATKTHVLCVYASEGQKLVEAFLPEDVRDLMPQARREVDRAQAESALSYERVDIEGSHHVHLTHPERLAPVINRFLQRTAAAAPREEQGLEQPKASL